MSEVNLTKEFNLSNQPHDLEWMMVDTRLRQSEAALKLAAHTNRWFLRLTGLGALGRFVKETIVNPLRIALIRRRTLADLRQLDDRLLADIGIERAVITDIVDQLVSPDRKEETLVSKTVNAEPLAEQCPTTSDEVEVVAPVTVVAPKAAANSNAAKHRAA